MSKLLPMVVVSNVKKYIKQNDEMHTSEAVIAILDQEVREMLDVAIDKAKRDGRKTVMVRDL